MNKTETKLFLTILFISLVTFTFSSLRDIDFFGKNFDDKMAFYYLSVTEIKKDDEKINIIKDLINNNCNSDTCKKRHYLRLNQSNNYLITSSIIKFFDNIINDEYELTKISKVVNYSFLLTIFLFYLSIIIFSYKSNKETKLHIVFLLLIIFLIDKKLLNINFGFLLPKYEYYNNYVTEYAPRAQAVFFSILSIIFCFKKKYFETFYLLIFASLFHLAIGLSLLFIFIIYYFLIKMLKLFRLDKLFYNSILIFCFFSSIFINQFALIPLLLLTLLILNKYKFNLYEKNFLSFFILVITGLFFLDVLFIYLNYLTAINNNSNYLSYILPSINSQKILHMTEIFSNSNFFHTLRHASAYLSPIFLIAFLVILCIKFDSFLFNLFKKLNFIKIRNKILIFFFIISLTPFLIERFIYIKNLSDMIDDDLIVGLKKENTFKNATQYQSIKFKDVDFNNEIFSQFMILKFLQGEVKYE